MTSVIFIRGLSPRCGTNYLGDILSCHPHVSSYPQQFWEFAPFRYHNYLKDYFGKIESCVHVEGFNKYEFIGRVGDAWLKYFNIADPQIPMFKEPSVTELDEMFAMFPQSKAIVIIRDGRDIICSQLKSGFGLPSITLKHPSTLRRVLPGEDLKILVKQLKKSTQSLSYFLDRAQISNSENKLIIVRYEDLVTTPQQEIPKILTWLGINELAFDWPKFQAMPVRGSSFLRDQSGKINFTNGVEKNTEFSPIHRWKYWSKSQLSYYSRELGDFFARFDYT
jgi:hypothetical protein